MESRCLVFDDFRIDLDRRLLYRGSELLEPERKEFDLLKMLVEAHPGTLTRRELIDRLWPRQEISDASLAQLIRHTRKLLGDDARNPRYIKTLHGIGLRWLPLPVAEPMPAAATLRRRIGLLPVKNASGRADNDWIEQGLGEILLQKCEAEHPLSVQLIPEHSTEHHLLAERYGCEALLELTLEPGLLPRRLSWRLRQTGNEQVSEDIIEAESIWEAIQTLSRRLPDLLYLPGEVGASQSELSSHSDNPEANRLYGEGLQHLLQGDYPKAEALFHSALDRDAGFSWARVKLADALYRQNKLDQAEQMICDSLEGDSPPTLRLEARQTRCNLWYAQGRLEASMRESGELIGLAREFGHRQLEANQWMSLGTCAQACGDEETAFDGIGRALRIYREIGYQPGIGNALYNLANIHHGLAQWESAYSHYEQAELIFEHCGQENHRAQARFEMALILRSMKQSPDRVRQALIEAGKVFDQTGDTEGGILVEIELIHCDLDQGLHEQSIPALQELLRRCGESRLAYPLFLARHQLIRAWLNLHRPDQAALLLDEEQEYSPSDPMFSLLEAQCAYERRDYAQAEKIALGIRREHATTWNREHQRMLECYQQARRTGQWSEMRI